ncbi:hypothetical protein J2R98_002898 [Alkalibacillus filiformis]|uniref:Uncharacterized protein n=1 Tax=Alkalibacillus filiformis TaxID=200990 RepID=A0ABU0DX83_9BACI|nr:hypothetical protein [Alkalibacillus filiformis]
MSSLRGPSRCPTVMTSRPTLIPLRPTIMIPRSTLTPLRPTVIPPRPK